MVTETKTISNSLNLKAGTVFTPPLKFTDGVALTTPETGAIEFHDSRFYITNKSIRKAIDRTSDVATETITVANTTIETIMWTGVMPANSLVAKNFLKFHADGVVSNDGSAAAADQITIRVRVGGVEKAILTPATKALSNDNWNMNANATQRTIGIAGSRAVHIDLQIDDVKSSVVGVAAIDTTANMNVTVTAQWGSAKVTNTISMYQAFMEYKN